MDHFGKKEVDELHADILVFRYCIVNLLINTDVIDDLKSNYRADHKIIKQFYSDLKKISESIRFDKYIQDISIHNKITKEIQKFTVLPENEKMLAYTFIDIICLLTCTKNDEFNDFVDSMKHIIL